MTAFETQRGITVRIFGKLNVDQSPRRGDDKVTRCVVTCGYITPVRRNTSVGVGLMHVIIRGGLI